MHQQTGVVGVGVLVGFRVGVFVGVGEGPFVGLRVGAGVLEGVGEYLLVGFGVFEGFLVGEGPGVFVGLGVFDGVGVHVSIISVGSGTLEAVGSVCSTALFSPAGNLICS